MKVAFAGAFATRLLGPVRALLPVQTTLVAGDEDSILPELADADVLVAMAFTPAMAAAAPVLRLVQVPGAGLDRVAMTALRPTTALANAFGHGTAIAEFIMGSLLALTRSLPRLDAALRQGHWESQWAVGVPAPPLWPELAGQRLAILGYGHIGEALARRAIAFDMHVSALRQRAQPAPPGMAEMAGPERLDALLAEADIIAVTLPLNDRTRGLIDRARLARMRRGAILVNVGRAEIVDEAALFDALAARHLGGAVLDVWWRYPTAAGPSRPSDQPFHTLPNVLMTPHVSGWTQGMLDARAATIAENVGRLQRGEPPRHLVAR